ncbi:4Fe-4S dicluster domain-containing protein, partial [Candidatus Cloacimonadota bacterium]
TSENTAKIVYNEARPTTPLKAFFFPVKENVVKDMENKQRVILGVTSCDLEALKLMDKIFLDEEFLDVYYKQHRENTILIGTDCHSILDTCHCTAYDLKPVPKDGHDIRMNLIDSKIIFEPVTEQGGKFLEKVKNQNFFTGDIKLDQDKIKEKNDAAIAKLKEQNEGLPNSEATRKILLASQGDDWKKHAKKCVSCGACSAICPTCHCFLLIDKKNFEKIKNWDTCQYPAFEKVAAGEDPLSKLYKRLKNRYMCKYIYKPDMFGEIACTGCGRCIDACIAGINKNEVILNI